MLEGMILNDYFRVFFFFLILDNKQLPLLKFSFEVSTGSDDLNVHLNYICCKTVHLKYSKEIVTIWSLQYSICL